MRTFDQIWIFDLHGSSKPKEHSPDGGLDENVFDIMKGVAIALFIKRPGIEKGVWYSDIWGSRIEKYKATARLSKNQMQWTRLEPKSPHYLFKVERLEGWDEYEGGWSVPNIFVKGSVGIATARDRLTIHFDPQSAYEVARDFASRRQDGAAP